MRSMRASTGAEIQRTSSGTRVPGPRTLRSIGPRWTVSIHTVSFCTVGAAGSRRDSPKVTERDRRDANDDHDRAPRAALLCFSGPWYVHSHSFSPVSLRIPRAKVSDVVTH